MQTKHRKIYRGDEKSSLGKEKARAGFKTKREGSSKPRMPPLPCSRAELRARLSELETKLKDREEIDRESYDEDTEKFLLELRTDRDK